MCVSSPKVSANAHKRQAALKVAKATLCSLCGKIGANDVDDELFGKTDVKICSTATTTAAALRVAALSLFARSGRSNATAGKRGGNKSGNGGSR